MFECCQKCVKPKRHPGCHDHCPEYAEERAKFDQNKKAAARNRGRDTRTVYEQRADSIKRTERNLRHHKRY